MILSLLLLATGPTEVGDHVVEMEHRAWHRCVTLQADAQSARTEDAGLAARDALTACQEEEHDTQTALLATMDSGSQWKKVDTLMTDWRSFEATWARKVIDAARTMPLQATGIEH
jgi:hypothetical protein